MRKMKTIADFTPEIRNKIPEYIEIYTKGVFDGGRYDTFDKKKAVDLINWNYVECKRNKPVVIVAENPLEAQIIFNYIVSNRDLFYPILFLNYCIINNIDLNVKNNPELESKLYSELSSQFIPKLRSDLRSKLESDLDLELDSKLYSELSSQLIPKLKSELYVELGSKLDSELHSKLNSELNFKLHSELCSQLHSKLFTQIDSKLASPVKDGINSNLNLKDITKHNPDYLFTTNVYSNVLLGWWKFIKDEFKINIEIGDKLDLWNDLYLNSGVYSAIFSEMLCVVSKYPKKVFRNSQEELHNIDGHSVEWGSLIDFTKFDCFYLNGRKMPSWVFEKYGDDEYFDLFLKEENEDIKAGVITLKKNREGDEGLLKFLNAELVDEKTVTHFGGYSEILKLYKTKKKYSFLQDRNGNFNQPYCWSEFTCPSTGSVYLNENSADFNCAIEAAKWIRPNWVPPNIPYKWNHSAN